MESDGMNDKTKGGGTSMIKGEAQRSTVEKRRHLQEEDGGQHPPIPQKSHGGRRPRSTPGLRGLDYRGGPED